MNTQPFFIATLSVLLVLFAGCTSDDLTSADLTTLSPANAKTIPGVSGTWDWEEVNQIVLPAEFGFLFGISPDGPVLRVTCHSSGELAITQVGDSFNGTASQQSTCETNDGQPTPTNPFPQGPGAFEIEGHITGRAVHFEALVGEGFFCPYNGSLRVNGGMATELHATGRCDVPIDAQPNVTKIISFDAVR
jgi:hypothetical protein